MGRNTSLMLYNKPQASKFSSYGQVQQRPAAEINDENVYENRLVRYHQLSRGPCHNLSVGSIQVNGHVTRWIMSYLKLNNLLTVTLKTG